MCKPGRQKSLIKDPTVLCMWFSGNMLMKLLKLVNVGEQLPFLSLNGQGADLAEHLPTGAPIFGMKTQLTLGSGQACAGR